MSRKHLTALLGAAQNLNIIVEGVRNERWASKGVRLKDTREWVEFYLALKRVEENLKSQT